MYEYETFYIERLGQDGYIARLNLHKEYIMKTHSAALLKNPDADFMWAAKQLIETIDNNNEFTTTQKQYLKRLFILAAFYLEVENNKKQ